MDLIDEMGLSGISHNKILSQRQDMNKPAIQFSLCLFPSTTDSRTPPIPSSAIPSESVLSPDVHIEINLCGIHMVLSQRFLLQILAFSLPLLDLAPHKPDKTKKTRNSIVAPFKKKSGKKKKKALQSQGKKKVALDIQAESMHVFLPEHDLSQDGLLLELGKARLEGSTVLSKAEVPLEHTNTEDSEELEEVEVNLRRFFISSSGLSVYIRRMTKEAEPKEVLVQVLMGVSFSIGMNFLVGDIPPALQVEKIVQYILLFVLIFILDTQ